VIEIIRLIIGAGILLLLFSTAMGSTYYVAPYGNDKNDGSVGTPWKSVTKGFKSAKPGDTVYFREGIYRQERTIESWYFSHKATKDARITFKSYPGETAVITCMKLRDDPSDWHRVGDTKIYWTQLSKQYLKLAKVQRIPHCSEDGIPLKLMTRPDENGGPNDLVGPGQWARSVLDMKLYMWSTDGKNPGTHQTEFCEFVYGGSNTIDMQHNPLSDEEEADYLTFEGLIIEGGYYPIVIGTDYIELKNCTFRNCFSNGIKVWGARPADYNNPDDSSHTNYFNSENGLIEDCNIYAFTDSGIDITGGDYWIVRRNKIHDGAINYPYVSRPLNGIMLKNNSIGTLVEGNKIYKLSPGTGITIGGISWIRGGIADEAADITVRNNEIYELSDGPYIILFQAAKNCGFYNNLIRDCNVAGAIIQMNSGNAAEPRHSNRDCKIKGNTFYNNRAHLGPGGWMHVLYYERVKGCVLNLESDYNTFHNFPEMTFYFGGSNKTFEEFRSLGYDVHSRTEAPPGAKNLLKGK